MTITREQADTLAATYLDEHEIAAYDFESPLPLHDDRHDQTLVITRVAEHDVGWVYFYDSSKHVESGDVKYALVGNAPLIVDKNDGKLYITGTAHPIEYYLDLHRQGIRTIA